MLVKHVVTPFIISSSQVAVVEVDLVLVTSTTAVLAEAAERVVF